MDLALGGAGADGAPADGIGDELRRDRVEELAASGQAQRKHVQQQLPREVQPLVDGEAAVEVGVVDQPLPADRRAGLLEVDAHDDAKVGRQLGGERREAPGVVERGDRIVDRAGPDDDDQAVIRPAQDAAHLLAGAMHRNRARGGSGNCSTRIAGGTNGRRPAMRRLLVTGGAGGRG